MFKAKFAPRGPALPTTAELLGADPWDENEDDMDSLTTEEAAHVNVTYGESLDEAVRRFYGALERGSEKIMCRAMCGTRAAAEVEEAAYPGAAELLAATRDYDDEEVEWTDGEEGAEMAVEGSSVATDGGVVPSHDDRPVEETIFPTAQEGEATAVEVELAHKDPIHRTNCRAYRDLVAGGAVGDLAHGAKPQGQLALLAPPRVQFAPNPKLAELEQRQQVLDALERRTMVEQGKVAPLLRAQVQARRSELEWKQIEWALESLRADEMASKKKGLLVETTPSLDGTDGSGSSMATDDEVEF